MHFRVWYTLVCIDIYLQMIQCRSNIWLAVHQVSYAQTYSVANSDVRVVGELLLSGRGALSQILSQGNQASHQQQGEVAPSNFQYSQEKTGNEGNC